MLQKLSDHIAHCLAQASIADLRASEASNETLRGGYDRLAKTWRHLASSYQFVESLERFLLDAERAKRARLIDPANENRGRMFPPAGSIQPPNHCRAECCLREGNQWPADFCSRGHRQADY